MRDVIRSASFVLALTLYAAGPAVAQAARVGGTVRSEQGDVIKGATVMAENPTAAPSTFTATTDDKGRFSIIGLRSGNWTFTAAAPGFAPSQGTMRVQTLGINTPVDFRLARGAMAPLAGAFATVDTRQLQRDLGQAEALFNAARYELAAEAYQEILEKVPALSAVQVQIGHAHRMRKDYEKALAAYGEVLTGDPVNLGAQVGIGLTNLAQGNLDAAEKALTTAAEAALAGRDVFYSMGEVKVARNQPEEAVRWYEKASTADPAWGKPRYQIGLMALKKGDKEAAALHFEKVLEIEPDSAEAVEARTAIEQLKK